MRTAQNVEGHLSARSRHMCACGSQGTSQQGADFVVRRPIRRVAMHKNAICLWDDHDAEDAARFYARTFPNSTVGAVHRAPSDFPGGKAGDVLAVEFTVCGVPCIGLNGGDT